MNAIIIITDSLRQDHAYDRQLMPNLNRFIDEHCIRFTRAYTTAPWTLAAHHAILNAEYPATLGVDGLTRNKTEGLFKGHLGELLPKHLPKDRPVEMLKERGYYNMARTGGGFVTPQFGFGDGFDYFAVNEWVYMDADVLAEHLDNCGMDGLRNGKSWMAYFQDFDCHEPFGPWLRENFVSDYVEKIKDRAYYKTSGMYGLSLEETMLVRHYYREACMQYDRKLMRLFDFIEKNGYLNDSMIFFLSDHGEELWDHGWGGHAFSLYEPVIKIPLAMHLPGVLPAGWDGLASSMDIFPTILGLPVVNSGLNLLDRGRKTIRAEVKFKTLLEDVEENPMSKIIPWVTKVAEISEWQKRVVTTLLDGSVEEVSYDLLNDPGETHPE